MLTEGMEDVYNPLLFGLNPSLCLSLCLSGRGQRPQILTHSLLCLIQVGKAQITFTQSLLPAFHKHLRSQETSINALMCLVSQIFPDGVNSLVRIKNILSKLSSDPSYHLETDLLSVICNIFTDRQNIAFLRIVSKH